MVFMFSPTAIHLLHLAKGPSFGVDFANWTSNSQRNWTAWIWPIRPPVNDILFFAPAVHRSWSCLVENYHSSSRQGESSSLPKVASEIALLVFMIYLCIDRARCFIASHWLCWIKLSCFVVHLPGCLDHRYHQSLSKSSSTWIHAKYLLQVSSCLSDTDQSFLLVIVIFPTSDHGNTTSYNDKSSSCRRSEFPPHRW